MIATTRRTGVLLLLVLAGWAVAATAEPAPASPVTATGIDLETARALPHAERTTAIAGLLQTIDPDAFKKGPDAMRGVWLFIAGEGRRLTGDYPAAAEDFGEAAKKLRDTPFADDAALARIRALEAVGADEEAADEWASWYRKYGSGPLAADARLAEAWNRFRRGDHAGAAAAADALVGVHAWMADDARMRLLRGSLAYAAGDLNAAAEHVAEAHDPAGLLLLAICQEENEKEFLASRTYQELLDRHPESPLRAYALLGKGRLLESPEDFRKASAEFGLVAERTTRGDFRAEAVYHGAACLYLSGREDNGIAAMRKVAADYAGQGTAAKALFTLGEMAWTSGDYEQAILEFNQVLAGYFDHALAGGALYRIGRCLDALGRPREANSTYQAVARGYPYAPEAPAAVYLAGVGLIEQGHPLNAAPYFQLVLDRYAGRGENVFTFETPQQQELVESALCLLEYSYYLAGESGLLAGAPHLALQKMPPSGSTWRAYALLLDADALASESRYPEAQASLDMLLAEYPDHPVGVRANRLLAWTYSRQGRQDLAIAAEQRMLKRYTALDEQENLAAAALTIAHSHFNSKKYDEAAAGYRTFLQIYAGHAKQPVALYQEGLCYLRLGRDGDAVDRWEQIPPLAPDSEEARKAWLRAGEVYFNSGNFADARRCFTALRDGFADEPTQATAAVRLGRCAFNEGQGEEAMTRFRNVAAVHPGTPEADEADEGICALLLQTGQAGEVAALEELAREHPESPLAPEARFELAMLEYESGNHREAAQLFEALASRYPAYSAVDRALFLAADSWEKANDVDLAKAGMIRFLTNFPQSELAPAATFRLGSIRFNAGQYVQASADFNEVLAAEAGEDLHAASLVNLAMSQRILGNEKQAVRALESYRGLELENHARDAEVAQLLGTIHADAGRHRQAAAEYKRAVAAGADASEAARLNYLAGLSLTEAGDRDGAIAAYLNSISAGEKSDTFRLSALAQAAALHEESGNYKQALKAYRDLIRNSGDPDLVQAARERVSQLEEALGLEASH